MRFTVITGFRLVAKRLHAPMHAHLYTQRGRYTRMRRKCEWVNCTWRRGR